MIWKSFRTNKWILSNPTITYRILRGVFRALVLRRNTLKVIQMFPTFDCQARCEMCSVARFKKGKRDVLTAQDYESIAEQGAKMGAVAATFLGGEPLLAKNIEDIIRTFKSRHFFVSIVSNGIAFDRDYARRLKAAGLDSIHFGLESLDEEANDKRRGYPGQSRTVLKGVQICKEEGLRVGLCSILFPGELDRSRRAGGIRREERPAPEPAHRRRRGRGRAHAARHRGAVWAGDGDAEAVSPPHR